MLAIDSAPLPGADNDLPEREHDEPAAEQERGSGLPLFRPQAETSKMRPGAGGHTPKSAIRGLWAYPFVLVLAALILARGIYLAVSAFDRTCQGDILCAFVTGLAHIASACALVVGFLAFAAGHL
jgi:hypothetical protein